MSERLKTNLLKYGITGAVCLGLAALYCVLRDFGGMSVVEKYRALCDGFTIPGLIALCVGALLWVGNDGFFYGLGYCLDVARKALLPGGRRKMERYYDYVERHRQKKVTGYGFLFVCGGACMAIAIIFLALFYRLY